jgi:RNA polymerase sigma factor (sigma-70 family)
MVASGTGAFLQHLRKMVLRADAAGLTDGQLLRELVVQRDPAAFEVLVGRHGPMVLGVCRRILRDTHDADDAFQATFLVLARKAASVSPPEKVGSWLYGVAQTTAIRLRAANARRRVRERQTADLPEPEVAPKSRWEELQPLLDQELGRLPDRYRTAILLCDLQGRSRREAARQLAIPEGTLSSRLTKGRRMLARQLTRRGVAISGGALAMTMSHQAASARVPQALAQATACAARMVMHGQSATGLISAPVATLMEGVLKAMFLTKVKMVVGVMLVAAALSGTAGLIYSTGAPEPKVSTEKTGKEKQRAAPRQVDSQFPDGQDHDFGKVTRGKILEYTFRIVNTSDAPLNLTSVRSSCGCMSGTVNKWVLGPKHEAQLKVRIESSRFVGPKHMRLRLEIEQRGTTEVVEFSLTAHSVNPE